MPETSKRGMPDYAFLLILIIAVCHGSQETYPDIQEVSPELHVCPESQPGVS